MKKTMNLVKAWRSDSRRIRHRFFLKDEILIGSDKDCDIQDSTLQGLSAHLTFSKQELTRIENGKVEAVPEGDLFQVGNTVFQWKRQKLWNNRAQSILIAGFVFLILVGGSFFLPREHMLQCNSLEVKLTSGNWGAGSSPEEFKKLFRSLQKFRRSFNQALRKKQLLKAKAELDSITNLIESLPAQKACGVMNTVILMRERFLQKVVKGHLKNQKLVEAAGLVADFRKAHGESLLDSEFRRILREARRLYLKGYRLEEIDADTGFEMMEVARLACIRLGTKSDCFRH